MKYDIVQFVVVLVLAGAFGLGIGYPTHVLLAAALGIIAWQLWRYRLLYRWLRNPTIKLPASDGLFYQLHKDIDTMRKRNKAQKRQLGETLRQFRQAAAILPDAVVILNSTGEIQWANRLASELLGIDWPNDANLRITNLLRNPQFIDAMGELSSKPLNLDIDSPRDTNRKVNIKIIDFEADSKMLVAKDITRLTAINQTQKDFVGNVSHELKTPLTVLRGYVETLQDLPTRDPSLDKPLDDMQEQVKRMQLIIQDLLYLSKLERGSRPNFDKVVNITEIIHDIHQATSPFVEEKQHVLELEIDTSLRIYGNDVELFSAFNNLVMNAIHYTPQQGVIAIKWYTRGRDAVLSVIDNGQGIAPKHLDRITERFYRVDSDRARHKGGTGLGLAIVKHVIDRHQGELRIQSNLGSGSCFECIFPEKMRVIQAVSKLNNKA